MRATSPVTTYVDPTAIVPAPERRAASIAAIVGNARKKVSASDAAAVAADLATERGSATYRRGLRGLREFGCITRAGYRTAPATEGDTLGIASEV